MCWTWATSALLAVRRCTSHSGSRCTSPWEPRTSTFASSANPDQDPRRLRLRATLTRMSPNANRLSALDTSFLDLEDAVSHMHIGSLGIFEGPAPAQDELVAKIAAKLPLVPRYRQGGR